MNTGKHHRTLRLGLGALLGSCSIAATAAPWHGPFTGLAEVAPARMADLRGGLELGGLQVDLTARVRTYIDGRLAAAEEHRVNRINRADARVESRIHDMETRMATAGALADGAGAAAGEATESGGTASAAGTGAATRETPVERAVTARDGGVRSVAVSTDRRGTTAVRVDLNQSQLVSTVANRANGRQVHHQMDVELRVRNFSEFASQVRSALFAARIGRAVNGQ